MMKKKMKSIICNLKAIPLWIKYGVWVPHLYEEVEETRGIVISTKDSFRISDNYVHDPDETVHMDATITKLRCCDCGKEIIIWYDRTPIKIFLSEVLK